MTDEVSYQLGFEDGYRKAVKDAMNGSFTAGGTPQILEPAEGDVSG